jgi:isopentenyl diphosphate isomerase/L-lactate dehydrogenase-like FMN-dependent dehydrogenase
VGLASFGAAGVDRVLEIMDNELGTIMRQVGALEHQSDHAGQPHARTAVPGSSEL